jgi:putative endonuclease
MSKTMRRADQQDAGIGLLPEKVRASADFHRSSLRLLTCNSFERTCNSRPNRNRLQHDANWTHVDRQRIARHDSPRHFLSYPPSAIRYPLHSVPMPPQSPLPRDSIEAQDADSQAWWLYLLACQDGRTYAGIAIDVDARFKVHLSGKGARFTRSNRPLKILGAQSFATKSDALKAEAALKKLDRPQRVAWARRWKRRTRES